MQQYIVSIASLSNNTKWRILLHLYSMYTLSVQPVLMATSIERQPLLKSQFQLRIYTLLPAY